MKSTKGLLRVLLLSATIITSVGLNVRAYSTEVSFANLKVPAYMGVFYFPWVTKAYHGDTDAGRYTDVTIEEIEGGGSYALDGYLANYSGSQKSEYKIGISEWDNTRLLNYPQTYAGEDYHLKGINHNSISVDAYIIRGSYTAN